MISRTGTRIWILLPRTGPELTRPGLPFCMEEPELEPFKSLGKLNWNLPKVLFLFIKSQELPNTDWLSLPCNSCLDGWVGSFYLFNGHRKPVKKTSQLFCTIFYSGLIDCETHPYGMSCNNNLTVTLWLIPLIITNQEAG